MHKFTFNRQLTGLFTDQQNQLAYDQEQLLSFIGNAFSIEHFEKQIMQKQGNYPKENRQVLQAVINKKYASLDKSSAQIAHLDKLGENTTFTLTTGHQLSIFTGPIYLIYKIIHVIRSCEELAKIYPDYHFTPIFWMASEDHDFEEIQSVELFNKTIKWETEQKGPVGRFELTDFDLIKKEIEAFFGNQESDEIKKILDSYSGENLSQATFKLINSLFAAYGLLVLDGDDAELKQLFVPVIEKELKDQFSYTAVHKTNEQIQKEGLKLQVNAREINLFYIENQLRERILHLDEGFFIEGKGKFSLEEMLTLVTTNPERFSPNVILRPVYQELILPNLCYVGGVGEISYWLQLKGVFDALNLVYPMIQVRSSILWIDSVTSKRIDKVGIVLEDLFKDVSDVKKNFLKDFASEDVDFEQIDREVEQLKNALIDKITTVDSNLEKYAFAETVKLQKQIEGVKDKLVRTVKQNHDSSMKTIDQIFDKLFPNGGMQERTLNLFGLSADGQVGSKISHIHSFIQPFDPDFIIIRE